MTPIAAMSRGQILTHVRDALLRRSAKVRDLEDGLIRMGHSADWHEDSAEAHDAMCAAALALDRVIARGKDQARIGSRIDPLIDVIVDALRSAVISEIKKREPMTRHEDLA